jgi:hypothetical protein
MNPSITKYKPRLTFTASNDPSYANQTQPCEMGTKTLEAAIAEVPTGIFCAGLCQGEM